MTKEPQISDGIEWSEDQAPKPVPFWMRPVPRFIRRGAATLLFIATFIFATQVLLELTGYGSSTTAAFAQGWFNCLALFWITHWKPEIFL